MDLIAIRVKKPQVIAKFTDTIELKKFVIYIFDCGAPTGLRLALKYPGPNYGDHLPKWQRLRGGIEGWLEPNPRLLSLRDDDRSFDDVAQMGAVFSVK